MLFFIGFIQTTMAPNLLARFLGWAIIAFSIAIVLWLTDLFFNNGIKKEAEDPAVSLDEVLTEPTKYNLADFLSFEVARSISKANQLALGAKQPEISALMFAYFLLVDNPDLRFIFVRANLDFVEVEKFLEARLKEFTPRKFSFRFWWQQEVAFADDFQQAILEALRVAVKNEHRVINAGDALIALAKCDDDLSDLLIKYDLKVNDIENLVWWLDSLQKRIAARKKFWDKKNLLRHGSLAREWSAGYTITLDKYSTDWTEIIKRHGPTELVSHKAEIETMERVLARTEINHILLVGEPGTGRKTIVHALAQKIIFGESLTELNYRRVIELDIVSLLSQTETIERAEKVLDQVFGEVVSAGNVILIIDEFHNYVGGAMRPGVIDISGVLAKYLQIQQFQIVGITTFAGLHKYIEQNPSVLAQFEKVEVAQPSTEETILILEDTALRLEQKHKRFVTYTAIHKTIEMASRYIPNVPFPKKAVDLLDEAMIYAAKYTKSSFILPEHVERIVTEKTQIPVGELRSKEKEMLLNLEVLIHQRIVNQEEAVTEVSAALRRARVEVAVRKGPMGTFLFLGPTGVGKTETAKALSEIYFGSEARMIRLDMSEFQNVEDTVRLLGSAGEEGLLTTPVRESPFSLILLDEIEKSHPNILNLFLQVLDEGYITDGLGRKIDFNNTIIIATSNAGFQIILQAIDSQEAWAGVKEKLLNFLFEHAIFHPEFINRFDAVVVFSPLSQGDLLSIAELLLKKVQQALAEKNIEFFITGPLKEKIAKMGYDPRFGARNMKRVIQDNIEDVLAQALLSDKIQRGDKIEIDPISFSIKKL